MLNKNANHYYATRAIIIIPGSQIAIQRQHNYTTHFKQRDSSDPSIISRRSCKTEVTIPLFSAFSCPEVYYAPDSSITISDQVEMYYRSLPPGFDPVKAALTVALESSVIRLIAAFIDNHHRLECILDPGCQVITISAIRCNKLGLAYNPSSD